jgi:hypothetical protein
MKRFVCIGGLGLVLSLCGCSSRKRSGVAPDDDFRSIPEAGRPAPLPRPEPLLPTMEWLRANGIRYQGLRRFAYKKSGREFTIRQVRRMRSLDLMDKKDFADEDLKFLLPLTSLRTLLIRSDALTDRGLMILGRMNWLTGLSLTCQNLTSGGLAHLGKLNRLTELYLSWNRWLTGRGLTHLAGLDRLQLLDLRGTRLTDEGLLYLKFPKNLRRLILNHTRITDSGLKYLRQLGQLRDLELTGTGITRRGLRHLEPIKSLGRLVLTGTRVDERTIRRFKKARPECIVRLGRRAF